MWCAKSGRVDWQSKLQSKNRSRELLAKGKGEDQIRVNEVGGNASLAQVGAAQASVGERDVDAEVWRARLQARQEVRRAHVGDHSCAQSDTQPHDSRLHTQSLYTSAIEWRRGEENRCSSRGKRTESVRCTRESEPASTAPRPARETNEQVGSSCWLPIGLLHARTPVEQRRGFVTTNPLQLFNSHKRIIFHRVRAFDVVKSDPVETWLHHSINKFKARNATRKRVLS